MILERDPEVLAACRIVDPVTIRSLIEALCSPGQTITIGHEADDDLQAHTRLVRCDAQGLVFSQPEPHAAWERLASSAQLQAATWIGGVALQFAIQAHLLDATRIGSPWPQAVFRLQRRDAFRIALSEQDAVQVALRDAEHRHWRAAVVNLSAVGIAIVIDTKQHEPAAEFVIGQAFAHCLLEFAARVSIPCELQIRQSEPVAGQPDWLKLGLAFAHLSPDAERAIQMAVMDFERKQRKDAAAAPAIRSTCS